MCAKKYSDHLLDQFPEIRKQIDITFEEVKSIQSYWKKRLSIEQNYARELESLAKSNKYFKDSTPNKISQAFGRKTKSKSTASASAVENDSTSTQNASWKHTALHTQTISDIHNQFAKRIDKEVVKAIDEWVKANEPIKKKIFARGENIIKKRKQAFSDLESSKKKYNGKCREAEKAQKTLDSRPNAEPEEKKRLKDKSKSTSKKAKDCERLYESAVTKANRVLDIFYDKEMPMVMTGLQNIEKTKYQLYIDTTNCFVDIYNSIVPVGTQAVFSKLAESVTTVSFAADTDLLISMHPSEGGKPAHYRVEYFRGQDDPSNMTVADIKKKSGNAPELEKILETLIDRLNTDCNGHDGVVKMVNSGKLGNFTEKATVDIDNYREKIDQMTKLAKVCRDELKKAGGSPNKFGSIPKTVLTVNPDALTNGDSVAAKSAASGAAGGEEEYYEEEYYDEAEIDWSAVKIGDKLEILYEYSATESGELDLAVGDIVTLISKDESGWWQGEVNGVTGIFPSNYSMPI